MESKTDPSDLYQISLLIDQLRHDDPQMRINATKNLYKIGKKKNERKKKKSGKEWKRKRGRKIGRERIPYLLLHLFPLSSFLSLFFFHSPSLHLFSPSFFTFHLPWLPFLPLYSLTTHSLLLLLLAQALGPDRTREELIPFLNGFYFFYI